MVMITLLPPPTQIFIKLLILFSICNEINSYDKEMTVNIDAGKIDCFYQNAKIGDTIDIDYQVIDGGHGDLDISFELTEPIGRIIFSDYKKSENALRHIVTNEGDYRFCFDNSFSSFNRKTIFFELIVENEATANLNQWNDNDAELLQGLTPEEFYDLKVQDILDYIGRIKGHITKARQIQDMIRSHEARDRNIAEENHFKVNAWSFFQICAMLCVGALQVIMVKSIFNASHSKMHFIWGKLGL